MLCRIRGVSVQRFATRNFIWVQYSYVPV